ncbi:MAG: hypothetical protein AAGF55_05040, partial [Pseudomonadota bacterium]
MIFVWLGRLLAWALLLFGVMRAGVGFYVANNFVDPAAYAAAMAALDENEEDTFGVLNAELTASDTHVDEFE